MSRQAPSDKQRQYLENLAARGFPQSNAEKKECARDAGYAESSLDQAVHQLNNSPVIKSVMQDALERVNITADYLAKKHKELLECKNPYRPRQPDNKERRKALEMAYKIRDDFPAHRVQIDKRSKSVNTSISVGVMMRAQELRPEEEVVGHIEAECDSDSADEDLYEPL